MGCVYNSYTLHQDWLVHASTISYVCYQLAIEPGGCGVDGTVEFLLVDVGHNTN